MPSGHPPGRAWGRLVLCLLIVAVHAIPATSRRDLLEDKDSTATSTSGRLLVALSKDGAAAAHSGSSSSLNSLSASIASAAGAANVKLLRNINMAILESVDVSLTVAALGSNPNVKSSGPDSTVQVAGVPNDELWNTLWGMDKIEMPAAWGITTGSRSVVVCVIDTGVDYLHPDLAANMWTNPGEIPGNGIDDDENGYVDDVYGINAITGSGDPMDDNMHGTHCAGTVGAKGNNTIGVVGVAPEVSIMGCKFLSASGSGSLSDALVCLDYAVGMGVPISSNSWGGGAFDPNFETALDNAGLAGHLFIAAAGNSARDNDVTPSYPASYAPPTVDAVMSVASVASNDMLSSFSQWGSTSVDLAAPGSNINSCAASVIGGGYTSISGTSMATPHVAGAAALLLAHNPDLTNLQIKQLLIDTCTPTTSLAGMVVSQGILNVRSALTGETPDPIELPEPAQADFFSDGSQFDLSGSTLTFSGPVYSPCVRDGIETFPSEGAIPVSLADDGSVEVEFGPTFGPFTFYNVTYEAVFIGSNGYLTFGEADTTFSTSMSNHNRLPRVSALYNDLTPDSASTVSYLATSDVFVITYDNIKQYGQDARRSTFQVALRSDGSISIAYPQVNTGNSVIVGLSNAGYSVAGDFAEAPDCAGSAPTTPPVTPAPPTTTTPAAPATTTPAPATPAPPTSTPPTTPPAPTTTTPAPSTPAPTTTTPTTTTPAPTNPTPEVPTPIFEMFWPSTPFDLAHTTITFNQAANYQPCLNPWPEDSFPQDPTTATQLPLADDASQFVDFTTGFVFTYFGQEYPGVHIGSNGYLTFVSPDDKFAASIKNHHSQPRISALYTDLVLDIDSTVSYKQLPDAFVVTYANVHEYGHEDNDPISFQIKMTGDGSITITFLDVQTNGAALVGLSSGDEEATVEGNLSQFDECPAPPPTDRMSCPTETPVALQWEAEGAIATCPSSEQTIDCVGGYFVVERLQTELFVLCVPTTDA